MASLRRPGNLEQAWFEDCAAELVEGLARDVGQHDFAVVSASCGGIFARLWEEALRAAAATAANCPEDCLEVRVCERPPESTKG